MVNDHTRGTSPAGYQGRSRKIEKVFIIWYSFDGEEDYTIMTALTEEEARRRFYGYHSETIIDIHEVDETEAFWAFI